MKTKYKIGDVLHYMKDNKVHTRTVEGISVLQGKIVEVGFNADIEASLYEVTYHFGTCNSAKEEGCHYHLDDLWKALIGNRK